MNDVARSDPSSVGTVSEQRRTRVGFIGAGVDGPLPPRRDARPHRHRGRRRLRAVARGARRRRRAFRPARVAGPAERARLDRFVATYADRLDAAFIITPHAFHFAQATACLEAGLDVLLEKPMVMTARRRPTGADRDARPDGAAARRRVPGQPVAPGPRGVPAAPLRRARRDPQHQRDGLAGLGDAGTTGTWRQEPAHLGRRLPVRHRRPHAEHGHWTSPARSSPRSRPGSRTMAGRSTSGPWSWAGSRRARSSP